jgi:predicted pyridoxine 5'-phosphate oxidase superfamily flavin-nucleotide-binding protein
MRAFSSQAGFKALSSHSRARQNIINGLFLSFSFRRETVKKRQETVQTMSKHTKYLLVSLPASITPSHQRDDALDAIATTITSDNGTVSPFPIPEFKIGTLDALVQQADELAKLESLCQGTVGKVGDALRNILDGDEAQVEQMKTVNDSMVCPGICLA